jgi:hypothetical protein
MFRVSHGAHGLCHQDSASPFGVSWLSELWARLREASDGIIRRYRTARKQIPINVGSGYTASSEREEPVSIRNVLDIRNDRDSLALPSLRADR